MEVTKFQKIQVAIVSLLLFSFLFYLSHQMRTPNFYLIYAVMTLVAAWAHTIGFARGIWYQQSKEKSDEEE
jgi:hypothetical protein